jgi:nickel transport protein
MRSRAVALVATVAVLAPGFATAHDFWLERAGDGLVLHYGHRGGELLAIEQAKVKAVRCLDKGATRELLGTATFAPREVMLTGRCGAASAFYDGGYWSLTPDGEVNRPKNLVPDAVKAWASRQFAKWVDPVSSSAGAILGDELELVAVSDLSKAHEGDKVTVRVLYRGKPVPNAVVAIDHKPLGETDSAGETRIKLRTSGVETISATLHQKVATQEADSVMLEASLSFEVAK